MLARSIYRGLLTAVLVAVSIAAVPAQAAPSRNESQTEDQQRIAPTYRVFATREGLVGRTTANGHVIKPRDRFVALPCWCSLSPKGSNKFQVRVTYKGRSVVLPVWDVGPWNTRDDYWNPGRRYSDLPVGRPMAEAAYYDGYNGGRDERGRRINNPNGIDIADGAFWDDLGMGRNDWVEVTFLWLGNDPGPGNATPVTPGAPAEPAQPEQPPPPVEVEAGASVVDNGAEGFSATGEHWSEARCGLNGKHATTLSTRRPEKATSAAAWAPPNLAPGFYEVKAYIPGCGGQTAPTTSARYRVSHDGAVTEVMINQEAAAGTWASLGIYHFGSEGQPKVDLADLTNDEGRAVRADALLWAPRADAAPPDASVVTIMRKDNGYLVVWDGTDDMSGIATYDVQVRKLPDGGWTDWKLGVSEESGWFGPDEGKQFAFRARARDWAGNLQPWGEAADMDTGQALPAQ